MRKMHKSTVKLKIRMIIWSLMALLFASVTFAKTKVEKEWTFLLFLNGHNNLSSYGDMNLKDMEKIGSNENLNIVVEWGKSGDPLNQRLLVQKSTDPSKVTSPSLMSIKDVDMGDYKNLIEFVKWGVDNFPAKHYFVAVWNHGSGWHLEQIKAKKNNIGINDISYDDVTGNQISTEQLAVAMGEIKNYLGRKVDIYGSDACLMQMLEVATEMKNAVNYIVGSEELEPGEGWPYEAFFKNWSNAPQSTAAEVSTMLSKEYLAAYSDGGSYGLNSVTFSAINISKLDAVLQSASEVSKQIQNLSAEKLTQLQTALRKVQYYYYTDYKDYGHFLKTLESLVQREDKLPFTKALSDMNELVIANNNSNDYKNASGISVWLPTANNSYLERYKNLEFNKLTGWSEFFDKVKKK